MAGLDRIPTMTAAGFPGQDRHLRATWRPPPAIRRPEQGNRWHMERGGQMGETGVVADEEICVGQQAGHRKEVLVLECHRPARARISHLGDHVVVRRPSDQHRNGVVGLEARNGRGHQSGGDAFVATAAARMEDHQRVTREQLQSG